MSRALRNGLGFSLSDISLALDTDSMDGDSRPRIISYLSYIIALKTRLVLWDFIPPHPSFSPIWIFSLILGPLLFFRFLENELRSRSFAIVGIAVYFVSTGFLSGVTMLFHAAKPLTNVVIIASFYLSAKIDSGIRQRQATDSMSALPLLFWFGLVPLLVVAPFVDETALFAYVIPLIWCPYLFWPRYFVGNRAKLLRNWASYLVPVFISAVIIFKVLPMISHLASGQHFDMVGYLHRFTVIKKLNTSHFIWNTVNFFIPGLLPWSMAEVTAPVAEGPNSPILPLIFLTGVLLVCTLMIRQRKVYWSSYSKFGVITVLFIMFHTFVFIFHWSEIAATGFYYGAIFSILFSSLVATVYADMSERHWKMAAPIGLAWVLVISIINFVAIDKMWITHSNWAALAIYPIHNLPTYDKFADWEPLKKIASVFPQPPDARIIDKYYSQDVSPRNPDTPFEDALVIWQSWKRGDENFLAGRPISIRNQWVLIELLLKRQPDLRWNLFRLGSRPEFTGSEIFRIYVEGFKKLFRRIFP